MPYLICSSDDDFFPLEGARKTFEHARRIWEFYGAADKVDWFHEPGGHGVYQAGRERIYAWMRRWLRGENPGARAKEPPMETEYEEDLNCTPTGQLATSWKGETPSSLNIRRYAELVPARSGLRRRVLRRTAYQPSAAPLHLQFLGRTEASAYRLERLSFDADEGLTVPALLFHPASAPPTPRPVLYVNQAGVSAAGGAPLADVLELLGLGYTVLALDPSGVGELSARWQGYADQWFGQEKAAWLALMTGRPLVALQMRDILRGVEVLAAKGLLASSGVVGVGRGLVGVALLHSAALDPRFSRLVLEGIPASYAAIARAPVHREIFEAVVPGVLREYDLPDLAAAVAPRPLCLLNVRSPAGARMSRHDVENEYRHATDAYRTSGSPDSFQVRPRREGERLIEAVPAMR